MEKTSVRHINNDKRLKEKITHFAIFSSQTPMCMLSQLLPIFPNSWMIYQSCCVSINEVELMSSLNPLILICTPKKS
jgi:hypothetical protein